MEQIPRRREIWIARVPFSDMSKFKTRPILILSRKSYNEKKSDVVGSVITSNLDHEFAIPIKKSDFEKNLLNEESAVRFDGLMKLHISSCHKKVGRVSDDYRKKVISKIIGFLE
jgi:mRNA-degrading endonuclease toxin of MazEF toxin-antitoxin module